MAYLAVEKDGTEIILNFNPVRDKKSGFWKYKEGMDELSPSFVALPKGSIEKLIGYSLTWKDEPVKI